MTTADENAMKFLSTMVRYDSSTGKFYWLHRQETSDQLKKWNKRYVDTEAGTLSHGYLLIGITYNGKKIKIRAHRLAWYMSTGIYPTQQIDHINHNRSDNRLENLRECSNQENSKNRSRQTNNTSGITGVYWAKNAKKWGAYFKLDGKKIHLGYFSDKDEATKIAKEVRLANGFTNKHGEMK